MKIKNVISMIIISWLWIFTLPIIILSSFIWLPIGFIILTCSFIISFGFQLYWNNIIVHKSFIRTFITNLKIYKWFYTKPIKVPNKHLILVHPHGILCCGVLSMIHFVKKSTTVLAVAPVLFYIPIFGWILRLAGAIPADYNHIQKALKKHSVILVLDGIAGIIGMEDKTLYIDKRYGAFKIAEKCKRPILPIWVHNEYKTFDVISLPFLSTRKWLSDKIGFPIVFPYICGWYGTWMPKRVSLYILSGEVIKPSRAAEMKNQHARSIQSLSTQVDSLEQWATSDNLRE